MPISGGNVVIGKNVCYNPVKKGYSRTGRPCLYGRERDDVRQAACIRAAGDPHAGGGERMGDHAVFSGRVPVAGTGAAPGGRAQPAVSPHLRGLCPGGGAGVRRGTGAVPREVAAEDRLCAGRPAGADLWRGAGLQNGDAVFLSPVQHGGHGSEQRPDGLLGGDLAWDLAESAHPGPDAPSGGPGGGLPPAAVPPMGSGRPAGRRDCCAARRRSICWGWGPCICPGGGT